MSRFTTSLRQSTSPVAAVGLNGGRVFGVSLDESGGRAVVSAHASEALPEHALVPALNAANVRDRVAVTAALARVLERIGRPRRIGMVLADPVAKVSLVRLQQVPARPQELEQVVRWQVRKTAPFSIDDAQVAFERGLHTGDGQEFIVTIARRDVIAEYEGLCEEAGAHAGIVDLATFNVVNMVLLGGAPPGDWLLVNIAPGWESVAIMRESQLIFFRNRSADGEGTLADLVHQTAMYYEDRLSGSGFSRVLLCGATTSSDGAVLKRSLSDRLSAVVDTVDPTRVAGLSDRTGVDAPLLDTLAPLVGLVLRAREAA